MSFCASVRMFMKVHTSVTNSQTSHAKSMGISQAEFGHMTYPIWLVGHSPLSIASISLVLPPKNRQKLEKGRNSHIWENKSKTSKSMKIVFIDFAKFSLAHLVCDSVYNMAITSKR